MFLWTVACGLFHFFFFSFALSVCIYFIFVLNPSFQKKKKKVMFEQVKNTVIQGLSQLLLSQLFFMEVILMVMAMSCVIFLWQGLS